MLERKFKMKICLLGDGEVGKTSLIRRFVFNEFDEKYLYTLGTNVSKKDVVLGRDGQDPVLVSLMIWDIMGQMTFVPLLAESYFDGADGAIGVCDLTRESTLEGLEVWLSALQETAGNIPLVILANKADLAESVEIREEELFRVAAKSDASTYVTSAKSGQNVELAFHDIAAKVLEAAKVDFFGGALPEGAKSPSGD